MLVVLRVFVAVSSHLTSLQFVSPAWTLDVGKQHLPQLSFLYRFRTVTVRLSEIVRRGRKKGR